MPKKKAPHLVSQYLELISSAALEQYQDIIRSYVRRRPGIYALYKKGKLYYVGLASNLRNRLKGHLKDRHARRWDRFSIYLTIGKDHMRDLESLILRISKPTGNKIKGKFRKAQHLRRTFAGDIRKHQKSELDSLLGRQLSDLVIGEEDGSKRKRGVLYPFLERVGRRLRGFHRGRVFKAKILRNGYVRFNGRNYRSPSTAGEKVVNHTCNGWSFWKYERAPGDWVLLNELRR